MLESRGEAVNGSIPPAAGAGRSGGIRSRCICQRGTMRHTVARSGDTGLPPHPNRSPEGNVSMTDNHSATGSLVWLYRSDLHLCE